MMPLGCFSREEKDIIPPDSLFKAVTLDNSVEGAKVFWLLKIGWKGK